MSIEEGIFSVREKIAESAKFAGTDGQNIKLVAVSKFKPLEDIITAYNCGVRDFGENYIQEFKEKYENTDKTDILWHIIGPVQRNKVKYIADKNVLVQTVDRKELAAELSRLAVKLNKRIPVLLQVNASGEQTKSGTTTDGLARLYEDIAGLENIDISGVMTIGPNTDDMKAVEECFEETRLLFEKLREYDREKIKYLSMGMTNDYDLAIRHGANIVRVGRAIFGERPQKTNN